MNEIPVPLWRHIVGPPIIGAGCLFIGSCNKDQLTLLLGALIAVVCLGKTITAYGHIKRGEYTTVTGTCVAVQTMWPLRIRRVVLVTDEGDSRVFLLESGFKAQVGGRLKLFFWKYYERDPNGKEARQTVETLRVIGVEKLNSGSRN